MHRVAWGAARSAITSALMLLCLAVGVPPLYAQTADPDADGSKPKKVVMGAAPRAITADSLHIA